MGAPAVLGYGEPGSINDRILGPRGGYVCHHIMVGSGAAGPLGEPPHWPLARARPVGVGVGRDRGDRKQHGRGACDGRMRCNQRKVEKRYGGGRSAVFRSGKQREQEGALQGRKYVR